jgi:predicted RNA-binding Zn ribbon-like protein
MTKQQAAPGALEHVRAFVNTIDIEDGTERLDTPEALVEWLRDRGLAEPGTTSTDDDLERAKRLREALRAILLSHTLGASAPAEAAEALDSAARRARVRLRFDGDGESSLEPDAGGVDGSLGRMLAIVHAARAQGSWQRLKACREHTCEWAFFDHTKNHSGTWCNMAVCGNRAKARTYRARQERATDP